MKQEADITRLLVSIREGDQGAQQALIAKVYAQLRNCAAWHIAKSGTQTVPLHYVLQQ